MAKRPFLSQIPANTNPNGFVSVTPNGVQVDGKGDVDGERYASWDGIDGERWNRNPLAPEPPEYFGAMVVPRRRK